MALIGAHYRSNHGVVKINHHSSNPFSFKKVLDKAVCSELFFLMPMDSILSDVHEDWNGGVTIGGFKVSHLRYAMIKLS